MGFRKPILKEVLCSVTENSCPLLLNFHCHTQYSDGSLTPEDLLLQACEIGLKHLAVTDHHNLDAYRVIQAEIDIRSNKALYSPYLWTGIEISCLLKKCLVHVLGYGFEINHPAIKVYSAGESAVGQPLDATNVVSAIHKAGGLAILAHPARYRLNYNELIIEAKTIGIDGGEAWYDYEMTENWKPTPLICNTIDKQLRSLGLLSTCGTDTHGLSLKTR